MHAFVDAAVLTALLAAIVTMLYVIAADRMRYLARFDLSTFPDRQYISRLPNFLQCLSQAGLAPWPRRLNAVAALRFQWRLRRILKTHPAFAHGAFIHHHLTLQALLTILAPYIDDAVLTTQQAIATRRILVMSDTQERDHLISFVAGARERHMAFYNSLTHYDRAILKQIRAHRFIMTLRSANAIFHEHGFNFLPALDSLRHWESLEGCDIAHDLPRLPKLPKVAQTASVAQPHA